MSERAIKPGDRATLNEGDCFGSTVDVVVVKVHKGGNVIVWDGYSRREVAAHNLTPRDENPA